MDRLYPFIFDKNIADPVTSYLTEKALNPLIPSLTVSISVYNSTLILNKIFLGGKVYGS